MYSFIYFLFLSFSVSLFCEESILVDPNLEKVNISNQVRYYIDTSSHWRLNEILKLKDRFVLNQKNFLDLGFLNSSIWLNFKIQNDSLSTLAFYLVLASPVIDYAELFTKSDDSNKIISQLAGDMLPVSKWSNPHFPDPTFLIEIPPNSKKNYYILLKTESPIYFPIYICSLEYKEKQSQLISIISWIFFIIVFVVLVYNFYLLFHYKKIIHLYYIFFILFFYLNAFLVYSNGYLVLWPSEPDFNNRTQVLFLSLSLASAVVMIQDFLNKKNPLTNQLNFVFVFFQIAFLCLSILCLMGIRIVYRIYTFNFFYFSSLAFCIYMLYTTWKNFKTLDVFFLLIGTSFFGFLGVLSSLISLKIIDYTPISYYSVIFLSPFLFVFLFYALYLSSVVYSRKKEYYPTDKLKKNYVESISKNKKFKLSLTQEEKLKEKIHFLLEEQKIYKQEFLNLLSFAKYLSIDPETLEIFFERWYHCNFREYLNRFRIEKAKQLLEITNINISALGFEVGFNDNETFLDTFKEITGHTPLEYKKKFGIKKSQKNKLL